MEYEPTPDQWANYIDELTTWFQNEVRRALEKCVIADPVLDLGSGPHNPPPPPPDAEG